MTASSGLYPEAGTVPIARLDEAVDGETQEAATLQVIVRELQQHMARLEALVGQQKKNSDDRVAKLEARLGEQSQRLERLGAGREKSMLELRRLEQELRLVQAERDALRRELRRLEQVQTETVAYDEESDAGIHRTLSGLSALPSINELMANLPSAAEPLPVDGFKYERVETTRSSAAASEWQEMLSPDAIVTDQVGASDAAGTADEASPAANATPSADQASPAANARTTADAVDDAPSPVDVARWRLLRSDTDVPQEYRLNGQLMTLGRSEMADIRVTGEFVSRIHARLLTIDSDLVVEDAGSKNGVVVNGDKAKRRSLQHGDEVVIGSVSFRIVDGECL